MKRGILDFVIVVTFGILLYYGTLYQEHLRKLSGVTFNIYPFLIFTVLFPIFIGVLLISPNIKRKIKSEGKLAVDKYKLIFMGIPTLYASLMPLFYFSSIAQYMPLGYYIQEYSIVSFAAGVALPYIIITSIKRNNELCK